MRTLVTLSILAFSVISNAQDNQPQPDTSFVTKGVGAALCKNQTESVQNNDSQRFLFGGFVQGYVTALNESLSSTFDLTPWQTDTTLGRVLFNYCQDNPNQQFVYAVGRVLISFNSEVLQTPSPLQVIPGVKPTMLLREDVIKRMIERLVHLGYGDLKVDAGFTSSVKEALEKFQKNEGLEISGRPTQDTLLILFARDTHQSSQSKP